MAYHTNKYKKKYRKPVNKKIIIISAAIVLVAGAIAVLLLTGIISINLPGKKSEKKTQSSLGYISFMNSYMIVGSDGLVMESRLEKPSGIPKISGLKFKSLIVGEKIVPENQDYFDYVVQVIEDLRKNSIVVDEVYITSDGQISLFAGNLKILLGNNEKTDEKINDLRDFFDKAKDLNGVLNMQEYSSNNDGYTFKSNQ